MSADYNPIMPRGREEEQGAATERNEEWMPVFGYEDVYEVSSRGIVRRCRPNNSKSIYISGDIDRSGYRRVLPSKNGRKKRFYVHRLVSHSENVKDAIRHGTWIPPRSQIKPNAKSKLKPDEVHSIRLLAKSGTSERKIAALFNISSSYAHRIITGERRRHV